MFFSRIIKKAYPFLILRKNILKFILYSLDNITFIVLFYDIFQAFLNSSGHTLWVEKKSQVYKTIYFCLANYAFWKQCIVDYIKDIRKHSTGELIHSLKVRKLFVCIDFFANTNLLSPPISMLVFYN